MSVPSEHLLALSAVLFGLGVFGFLVRRNVIVVLASIELMLNAANLAFVAGARSWAAAGSEGGEPIQGTIFVLFVVLIAAAEAAVGLALIIALYRLKQTVALDAASQLRG